MTIRIRLFAVAKELAGTAVISVEVPEGSTIGQLRAEMAGQHPRLAQLASTAAFAFGNEYVHDDFRLLADQEIACIPPVSGG